MTSKTFLALAAALAFSTALSSGAEARGFGGGGFGGARMGGGGMFRSAPMKMSTFKAPAFKAPAMKMQTFKAHRIAPVKTFKPSNVTKHVKPAKTFVHKEPKFKEPKFKNVAKHLKHDVKPKLDAKKVHVTKNLDKLKANKLFAHKLNANKIAQDKLKMGKLNVIKPGHAKLAFHHPKSLKLLPAAQLQKALPFDAKGNKYSMMKKAWWDGKHWWKGTLAWTFIGGAWYYGDDLWYEEDGVWRTESGFLAECLDCEPVVVTRTRVASSDPVPSGGGSTSAAASKTSSSGSGSPGSSGGSASSGNGASKDKPVKTAADDGKTKTTTEMSTEAVLIRSNTSGIPGTEGETLVEPPAEIAASPDATEPGKEAVQVAEAVVPAPAGGATMNDATTSEPAASPALDCKRFVPTVSMTISVPCGK